jgi:hypothetical protein
MSVADHACNLSQAPPNGDSGSLEPSSSRKVAELEERTRNIST